MIPLYNQKLPVSYIKSNPRGSGDGYQQRTVLLSRQSARTTHLPSDAVAEYARHAFQNDVEVGSIHIRLHHCQAGAVDRCFKYIELAIARRLHSFYGSRFRLFQRQPSTVLGITRGSMRGYSPRRHSGRVSPSLLEHRRSHRALVPCPEAGYRNQ